MVLEAIFFLIVWVIAYFIIDFGTWWLAFLIAILFSGSFHKSTIVDLAKNFDRNHNNLLSIVDDLKIEVENLSRDYDETKNELLDAQEQIKELEARLPKPYVDHESAYYSSLD